MDDYEISDCECPACKNSYTHARDCHECNEGTIVTCIDDLCHGSDHCIHGDGYSACPECSGTGIQRWCPKCGADYWRALAALRAAATGGER